ncbi:MAG: threonylcarbamoyladenosine tRNA methylthiotransferase MtaB [Actinomycetota bacterium]|jgi:threonylcarbamoyladenosine tRNA methylthiotransferase MtaB|nr:threonylcarbamoyladenosine tRNA methylthiotransferase MtaB [Actinomycetota bacterium]
MSSALFTTLGCRLNQAESDAMAEQLAARGVGAPAEGEEPQLVVINTCTVTREATKASRMAIRRAIKTHPGARVVVAGCYAVSDRDEVEAIDGVDVIVDNYDKERIGDVLAGHAEIRPLLQIGRVAPTALVAPKVRANLKAQTGCDEWCSFCIIPTTRGPLRSMNEDDLVAEARRRVAAGTRELVLTGVHLGKYTYDHGGDERSLVRLFERLLGIPGVLRIRLSSILSRHLTDEVVSFMAQEPRMCRYLHVPMQSGDDAVLADMNRPYRIDDYVSAIERACAVIPGLALATDVIVGFPTETEEAFSATMDVVARLRFSKLHVFRYSPRPDTEAAAMPDTVGPDIKKQRSKRLIDLGNTIRRRFLEDHLGRPLEVLVEDEREVEGVSVCSGQTDDYVRLWFEGCGLLGRLAMVRGHEIRADGIRGAELLEVRT